MNKENIALTIQDILEKDFKIDTRGYRPQEVDQFLDVVIRDYNEYDNIIKGLNSEINRLVVENDELKQEVRDLKSSIETIKKSEE